MSLPEKTYREMDELARKKNISRSELLRDALVQYVASETEWGSLMKLGQKTARELGFTTEDNVDRLVHGVRKEMRQKRGKKDA